MKSRALTQDYLERAEHRLAAIELLFSRHDYADVVRETQEAVELMLKALLRMSSVEVPHIHEVGDLLIEHRARLPRALQPHVERFAQVSRRLRRDRELAFYGSEDLTPSDFYKHEDAESALTDARFIWEQLAPFKQGVA